MSNPSVPAVNFYIQYTPSQVTPPQVAAIVTTGTSASGSNTLTVASGLTIWTNSVIVGTGIAAGTTVTSYSSTTVTLSANLTASVASGAEFTVVGPQNNSAAWTGYNDWIESISIRMGRQHYLDRMESATLELNIDDRTGAFSSLGTTITPRVPILVTATYNNYTYAVFNGIIESVDTRLQDQLNSDLMIRATDNLKFLALKYVNNTAFYSSYVPQATYLSGSAFAQTTGAVNWYRMNSNSSFNGTLLDNLPYNATTSPYSGLNGSSIGNVPLNQPGVLLYENTTCADLTGGTGTTPQGSLVLGGSGYNSLDFWIIGQGTAGETIFNDPTLVNGYGVSTSNTLSINAQGQVVWSVNWSGVSGPYTVTNPTPINDGFWHHVAITADQNFFRLYVDGVATSVSNGGIGTGFISGKFTIGTQTPNLSAYIDEVVTSNYGQETNTLAILDGQIKARYLAGRLLRKAQNSADRVAEILVASGFGSLSISNATFPASVAVNPNNLFIDSPWFGVSAYAYTPNSALNGTIWVQGMTSPVTKNTCQDLILGITDTECGNFHQSPAGMFMFRSRDYPYTVANATTSQGKLSDTSTAGATNYDPRSFDFSRDDVDTWTTVIVQPQNGIEQVYNTGLGYLYGDSTYTKSGTQNNDLVSAKQTANYLAYIFQSPLPRVTAVEIHSENYKGGGTNAAIYQSLNRCLEDRVTLYYTPTGVASPVWSPTASPTRNYSDFLIEAITHTFEADPGRWTTSFTLDPYPLRFDQQNGKTVAQFGSTGVVNNNYVFL